MRLSALVTVDIIIITPVRCFSCRRGVVMSSFTLDYNVFHLFLDSITRTKQQQLHTMDDSSNDDDDDGNDNVGIVTNSGTQVPIPKNLLTIAELWEFQRIVAVYANNSNARDMMKKDEAKYIYEVVHGSATKASQLNLMAQGSHQRYKKLYAPVKPIIDPTSNVLIEHTVHLFYSPNRITPAHCQLAKIMKFIYTVHF